MPDLLQLGGAFALAFVVTAFAVPFARRIALQTDFVDHPVGFKRHLEPTPYLGGVATTLGFVTAVAVFGEGFADRWLLLGCVLVLFAVGTIDDRVGLPILPRLTAQALVALALWRGGFDWELFNAEGANLAVTLFWVVGVVNAFNLLDNIDGAAGTVASASAAGLAALALVDGDVSLAAMSLALAGGCAAFLLFNLSRPAKIFLGDGGSMPIGLALAALTMAAPASDGMGFASLPALAPLVGVAIFDTTLVVVSRYRRGNRLLSGARDHVTHRLLALVGTPQRVALVLLASQALLCGLAIALSQLGQVQVAVASVAYLAMGAALLFVFERPPVAPRVAERAH